MSKDLVVFTRMARVLHWLTAVGIVLMVPAGFLMLRVGSGELQNFLFDFHRSMGVLLFVITAIRLIYRLCHSPPPLPESIPNLQKLTSRIVHTILYVFLLLSPIVGWLGTSAFGAKITVFGLFVLPPIVDRDRDLARIVLETHEIMGLIFTFAVVLHIGAALYHHFIQKDEVLSRMLTVRNNRHP